MLRGAHRDALDSTLNYGAHVKFVSKWLDKLEAEKAKAAEPAPEAAPPEAAPEGNAGAESDTPAEAVQA